MSLQSLSDRLLEVMLPRDEVFDSEFDRRRAILFVQTAFTILFWGPVVACIYLFVFDSVVGFAVAMVGSLLCGSSLPVFRYTGRIELAVNMFVLFAVGILTGLALLNGGFAPPLAWLAVFPMLAILFSGYRSGWAWLAIVCAIFTGLYATTFYPQITFPQILSDSQIRAYRYLELVILAIDVCVILRINNQLLNWLLDHLREREEQTQTILETAPDGILATTPDGQIQRANRAAAATFEWEDPSGLGLDELLPDIELDQLDVEHREEGGFETTARRRGGESFPAHVEVGKPDDSTAEWILAVQDITRQKRRERELRQARDEAIEASRAKSTFLANISHELRTPLNAIIGYSEMLMEDGKHLDDDEDLGDRIPQDRFVSDLGRIKNAGDHLLGLIDDVLDLSKIEAGQVQANYESVDLEGLFADLEATLEPLAADNDNELVIERGPDLETMRTDRQKLRQILLNLAGNSCKFTEEGQIRISATRGPDADRVVFEVSDTGIGMSDEELEEVFEAFKQADASSTREHGGTGLGLAICKQFTDLLDGQIRVESTPGEGTSFEVQLPDESRAGREETETEDAADDAEVTEQPSAPDTAEDPPTVLIVDDDPEARELLARVIRREGWKGMTASNGPEALELAREVEPSAITLDIKMPEMDGWTVLSEIQDDPELSEIPVILVTMVSERTRGLAVEAEEFLTKPIDRDELVETLSEVAGEEGGSVMVVEDDAPTRELMVRTLEDAGWETVASENGEQALERLEETSPSLVLLDLMMPKMDGFEFLARVRLGDYEDVPVVVVTAKELTDDDRAMLEDEVIDVVQKGGFEQEELLDQVRQLVDRAIPRRES